MRGDRCLDASAMTHASRARRKEGTEMSRDTLPGKAAHHRLIIGVDTMLPEFFGQVIETAEDGEEAGDEPLVWVGGGVLPVRDLGQVVEALKPYGEIPLALQLQLVDELDTAAPFPLRALGKQLAAVCRQAPESAVTVMAGPNERIVLMLGEQGWQSTPWLLGEQGWQSTPWLLGEEPPAIANLFSPFQQVHLDSLSGYSSDPSLLVVIHDDGMGLGLPVCAVTIHGAALCGPVALLNEGRGLSATQVQVVQREVFCYVDTFNLVFFLLPFFPTSQSCGRCRHKASSAPGDARIRLRRCGIVRVGPSPVVVGRRTDSGTKPLCTRG